jgi:hypothetical protein
MEHGNYAIREGARTVAYVQIGKAGITLMPRGIKATALDALQRSIEEGTLPKEYTARKIATELAGVYWPSPEL